jgi:Ribosome-associated chaperone zuotin
MALTITATITVADDQAYTPREAAILAAMQVHPSNGAPAAAAAAPALDMTAHTKEAADARIAESRAKAAAEAKTKAAAEAKAKAAADTKAAAAQAAEEAAAAEEPAVDNDAEALAAMEADLVGDAPTLDDAVSKATKLVSEGKTAQVKAALLAAGAKRVSELKGAGISVFLNSLEG